MRVLSNQIDRATWRNTLFYRLSKDLQVGVEYNPLASDVRPMANWRWVRETRNRPSVIFGTSSDRIGTPEGQAYYVTFAKDLKPQTGLPVSPYIGLLYSEFDERFRFPMGASIRLGKGFSLNPAFDGHAFHLLGSYSWDRYTVTGILVRGRDPGIAFTVGF